MLIRGSTVVLLGTERGGFLDSDETMEDSGEHFPVRLRWSFIITATPFQQMNHDYNNAA